jgi:hypothetical protein
MRPIFERARPILSILIPALVLSGCTSAILYTHTVEPLDLNMHSTPFVREDKEGAIKHIDIHFYSLSAAWDSNAIGDIARKNNLETVYFADLEYLNVLQIWKEYIVHVYGK